jgi:DNA-binding MarR family transcriptional regulator
VASVAADKGAQLDAHLNRQLHDSSDLSGADYEVVVPLGEAAGGRSRVFEVGQELHGVQGWLPHRLARMQKRGLISREHCDTDRRG